MEFIPNTAQVAKKPETELASGQGKKLSTPVLLKEQINKMTPNGILLRSRSVSCTATIQRSFYLQQMGRDNKESQLENIQRGNRMFTWDISS